MVISLTLSKWAEDFESSNEGIIICCFEGKDPKLSDYIKCMENCQKTFPFIFVCLVNGSKEKELLKILQVEKLPAIVQRCERKFRGRPTVYSNTELFKVAAELHVQKPAMERKDKNGQKQELKKMQEQVEKNKERLEKAKAKK